MDAELAPRGTPLEHRGASVAVGRAVAVGEQSYEVAGLKKTCRDRPWIVRAADGALMKMRHEVLCESLGLPLQPHASRPRVPAAPPSEEELPAAGTPLERGGIGVTVGQVASVEGQATEIVGLRKRGRAMPWLARQNGKLVKLRHEALAAALGISLPPPPPPPAPPAELPAGTRLEHRGAVACVGQQLQLGQQRYELVNVAPKRPAWPWLVRAAGEPAGKLVRLRHESVAPKLARERWDYAAILETEEETAELQEYFENAFGFHGDEDRSRVYALMGVSSGEEFEDFREFLGQALAGVSALSRNLLVAFTAMLERVRTTGMLHLALELKAANPGLAEAVEALHKQF
jgi:hypothetical protein